MQTLDCPDCDETLVLADRGESVTRGTIPREHMEATGHRDPRGWEVRVEELVQRGLSSAEAVDYLATVEGNHSQTAWSDKRGRSQQAVSNNVQSAKAKLGE